MSAQTFAQHSLTSWFHGLNLTQKLRALPLPVQVVLNGLFALLLVLDVVVPDVIPLLDEALLTWLLWTGTSALIGTVRHKRLTDRARTGHSHPVVDEPEVVEPASRKQSVQAEEEDPMWRAAQAEVEATLRARA